MTKSLCSSALRLSLTAAIATILTTTSLTSSELQASRARPRTVAATENVRLAIPRPLEDVSEKGATGLDFEDTANRDAILQAAQRYIKARRTSTRKTEVRECSAAVIEEPNSSKQLTASVEHALCLFEFERKKKASTEATPAKRTRAERREVAGALLSEHWDAADEIPYQGVVGIVGSIDTKAELLAVGKALSAKSECVGSKVATAIAYKLEEHFPDTESIEMSRKLYAYSSQCGTDFAAAKAAYRLALLDVWQNQCSRVPALMSKVEGNREATQFHSRAKYWRAYCGEVLGKKEISRDARESLLFEYPMTFHNLAANGSQDMAIDWVTRDNSPTIAFRSLVRPDLNAMIRAIEGLIKAGAADLGTEMADRSVPLIKELEPEVRLYLAALLHKQGEKHNQALAKFKILAALFQDSPRSVSGPTMRLYFPLWFFDVIQPSSAEIDPLLVTALIRQESAFNIRARSRVGARGLMQLMPATAKMISSVRTSSLFDPKTNVSIGTRYLRKRLAQFNGDVELTLAAYNAGAGKVDEWKKRYPTDNRILFLDLIPYKETREYVASILRNYFWYTKLYGIEALASRAPAESLGDTYRAITRAQSGLIGHMTPAAAAATTTVLPEPLDPTGFAQPAIQSEN